MQHIHCNWTPIQTQQSLSAVLLHQDFESFSKAWGDVFIIFFFSFLLWLGPLVSSFYSVETYCLPTSEETAVSCPEEESNCCKKFCYYLHKITYSVLFLFELLPYPLWLRHCCPLGLLCSHRTHVLRFNFFFFLAESFGSLSPKSLMKSCDRKFIYYYLDWRSFIFSLY